MEDDDDLARFSSKPLTADEWRRIRRDLALLERIRPLVATYENGKTVGWAFMIIGAWLLGALTSMLGIFGALRYLNWWPFNGVGS